MSYRGFSPEDIRLYAITDRKWLGGASLAEVTEQVLQGGVTLLQYREKHLSYEEMVQEAFELKKIAVKYQVPLIINDNVQLAKEIDADGVHLGQKDMSLREARDILGYDKIIGVTAPRAELAIAAWDAGADYIGAGAVFSTDTKQDTSPLSIEALSQITKSVKIPVVAIGGIQLENVHKLQGTGIAGVAVISGIFGQDDPGVAARKFTEVLQDWYQTDE